MGAMFQRVLMNAPIADTNTQINQKHLFHLARIGIKHFTVKIVGIFFLVKVMHLKTLIPRRSISPCFLLQKITMNWVNSFENYFSVKSTAVDAPYLIIEGECRYLQALGGVRFALSATKHKKFFNQQGCMVYDDFDVVSFLVTDWIKIQDSLEMMFNLLTGCPIRSLQILSYLRGNTIPTHEFALYLYIKHKIIFVNRFNYPIKHKKRCSQLKNIEKMINNLNSDCHFLIVGDREYKKIYKSPKVIEIGKVVHPSGVVLNTHRKDYFRTWYQLNDKGLKYNTANFSLRNFSRLS